MFKKIFLAAFAAATLSACSDNEAEPIEVLPYGYGWAEVNDAVSNGKVIKNMLFFGLSNVTTVATGSVFPDDTALFELEPAADGTLYLYMHATRFAVGMPAVEMRIPTIAYTDASQGSAPRLTMTLTEVAPENWVEAAREWQTNNDFKITGLSGTVDNLTYQVTFTCSRKVKEKWIDFKVGYNGRLLVRIK